jgi:hypothetical protein
MAENNFPVKPTIYFPVCVCVCVCVCVILLPHWQIQSLCFRVCQTIRRKLRAVISGLRRGVNEICAWRGDFTQRRMVVSYRRFGTTCRSNCQRSSSPRRLLRSWDNVVSIVARLRTRPSGVPMPAGLGVFLSSSNRPNRLWGQPSLVFNGYWGSFPGVKRPRRGVDHSPTSSAEVENEWSCSCAPRVCLHGMDRDNLFYLFVFRA